MKNKAAIFSIFILFFFLVNTGTALAGGAIPVVDSKVGSNTSAIKSSSSAIQQSTRLIEQWTKMSKDLLVLIEQWTRAVSCKEVGIGGPCANGESLDSKDFKTVSGVINKITEDTVKWVNTGDQGNPMFVTNLDDYLTNVSDQATIRFFEKQFDLLPQNTINSTVKNALMSDYIDNYSDRNKQQNQYLTDSDSFVSDWNNGGAQAWDEMLANRNNIWGAYTEAENQLDYQIQQKQQNELTLLNQGDGFKPYRATNNLYSDLITPGSVVGTQANNNLGSNLRRIESSNEYQEFISDMSTQFTKRNLGLLTDPTTLQNAQQQFNSGTNGSSYNGNSFNYGNSGSGINNSRKIGPYITGGGFNLGSPSGGGTTGGGTTGGGTTGGGTTGGGTTTKYTLSINKLGTGSGVVSGGGITCGTICSQISNSGTSITLTATPGTGATFTGWSGACTGTGTCAVTLNSNKTVGATFNGGSSATPTVVFAADPTSIKLGSSSKLLWSSINTTSCSGTNFVASSTSGSITVSPATTTTYTITCIKSESSVTQSAKVTVTK
ncbi:MAG: hypothetical protein WCW87_00535 [Candidatus Paceibacterota bacterium]